MAEGLIIILLLLSRVYFMSSEGDLGKAFSVFSIVMSYYIPIAVHWTIKPSLPAFSLSSYHCYVCKCVVFTVVIVIIIAMINTVYIASSLQFKDWDMTYSLKSLNHF